MPAGVVHSATEAHNAISAILTGLTDRSAIGFIASGLVLATFGMKDMVNLRIVAICSNIAFIMYGFLLDLPPVLILHVMLLPLNGWRLMGVLKRSVQGSVMAVDHRSVSVQTIADPLADERLAIGGGV
jgi:hypothetical protein